MSATTSVDSNIDTFLQAIAGKLAGDVVLTLPDQLRKYSENVGAFQRCVPLVVCPQTTEQVIDIVRQANIHRVSLYPISTGRNWGLGSRAPVKDGCVVVDLGRMRRISAINEEFGYAVIEPGVSQGQLADHLVQSRSRFMVDVTGSGRETSIVGNLLERGSGYSTFRADTLVALEVVLGDGRLLKTGYSHFPDPRLGALNAYGLGPGLSGLFLQSNYGIVTGATVRLLPRPAHVVVFTLAIRKGALPSATDALRALKQSGAVGGIVHVANRQRRETIVCPIAYDYHRTQGRTVSRQQVQAAVRAFVPGEWVALGHVAGTAAQCRSAIAEVRRLLRPVGRVVVMTQRKLAFFLSVARALRMHNTAALLNELNTAFGLVQGQPTDEGLRSIYWHLADASVGYLDPDHGQAGLRFNVPAIPMDGQSVQEAVEVVEQVAAANGFVAAITLNTIHATCLEGVVSIDFDRADPVACDRARDWSRATTEALSACGYYPLRADIDSMLLLAAGGGVFWEVAQDVKRALDPNGIIAPGRYVPDIPMRTTRSMRMPIMPARKRNGLVSTD
jgi:4-cresol dehydrogenase (hydroxylating) flavoprotein subunit